MRLCILSPCKTFSTEQSTDTCGNAGLVAPSPELIQSMPRGPRTSRDFLYTYWATSWQGRGVNAGGIFLSGVEMPVQLSLSQTSSEVSLDRSKKARLMGFGSILWDARQLE